MNILITFKKWTVNSCLISFTSTFPYPFTDTHTISHGANKIECKRLRHCSDWMTNSIHGPLEIRGIRYQNWGSSSHRIICITHVKRNFVGLESGVQTSIEGGIINPVNLIGQRNTWASAFQHLLDSNKYRIGTGEITRLGLKLTWFQLPVAFLFKMPPRFGLW